MRSLNRLLLIFPLVLFALPLSIHAQFQAPTDEELKMTAEPKAPGAAAIYLYREESDDDNLHFHSFFARIKVLTEKGKELATVEIPYPRGKFTLTDVKARTIHSDGKVIPLAVKPSDLVVYKAGEVQINKMVFTLPSVEVGSILEYRWELRYEDEQLSSPFWDVEQTFFVRKAHYSFNPYLYLDRIVNARGEGSSKLLYSSILPAGTLVQKTVNGRYSLDVTDVLALPAEEFMPPLDSMSEQVKFYYSPYISKDEFWKDEGNIWSKDVNRFASESKELKDAVSGLVGPTDSDEVKASKIYDAVMALDNTDYSRKKSKEELKQLGLKQNKVASDVWKAKSGSSDEIAELYLAMARIAGLKANAAYLVNRERTLFSAYYLSMSQFDDVLVYVTLGGKDVLLDPGEKDAPFGQLHWKHYLTGCIRQSDAGVVLATTPGNPYKEASTVRTANLTVGEDGSVTGSVRISMNGPEALNWRHIAIENDPAELKKQFEDSIRAVAPDGVNVELDHFIGQDTYTSVLMAVMKVTGNMGATTGKRAFLPGAFFDSHARHPFVAEAARQISVDMHYAQIIRDEVTYNLPSTFTVENLPADSPVSWPAHAVFIARAKADKQTIQMSRSLAVAFTFVDPKNYGELRDFYQKVAAADQQQIVLVRAPQVSSN